MQYDYLSATHKRKLCSHRQLGRYTWHYADEGKLIEIGELINQLTQIARCFSPGTGLSDIAQNVWQAIR